MTALAHSKYRVALDLVMFIGSFCLFAISWLELSPIVFLLVIACAFGALLLMYPKYAFYACFFLIPLSFEIELDFGLTTDLFGEPILWILLIATFFRVLRYGVPTDALHWLTGLIAVHICWIAIASIFSSVPVISWKYFLSKLWFVLPVFLFPFYLTKEHFNLRLIAKGFVAACFLAGFYYIFRLYQSGFSFDARVLAGAPIWRNHVNYACTMLLALPFIRYLYQTTQKGRLIYSVFFLLCMVMIYFAYARVAYIALAFWLLMLVALRLRKVGAVIILAITMAIGGGIYLGHNNHYLSLAPEYSQAIAQHKFEDLVTATTEKKDISSMERLYRWMAASQMIMARPIGGWGPGSFYSQYKAFTVKSFQTYVSDNPDKSGVHAYFLMILVEQGVIGLMIWMALICGALLLAQKLYFATTMNPTSRALVSLAYSIIALTIAINSINDMVEVIKMGIIFWFSLMLLIREKSNQPLHIP